MVYRAARRTARARSSGCAFCQVIFSHILRYSRRDQPLRMSDELPRVSHARRFAVPLAKLTVSLALFAFLFSRVDVGRLWSVARQASVPWLVAALVVYGLTVVASTWRWHLLLNAQQVYLRLRTLFVSFLVANFFNNFLP